MSVDPSFRRTSIINKCLVVGQGETLVRNVYPLGEVRTHTFSLAPGQTLSSQQLDIPECVSETSLNHTFGVQAPTYAPKTDLLTGCGDPFSRPANYGTFVVGFTSASGQPLSVVDNLVLEFMRYSACSGAGNQRYADTNVTANFETGLAYSSNLANILPPVNMVPPNTSFLGRGCTGLTFRIAPNRQVGASYCWDARITYTQRSETLGAGSVTVTRRGDLLPPFTPFPNYTTTMRYWYDAQTFLVRDTVQVVLHVSGRIVSDRRPPVIWYSTSIPASISSNGEHEVEIRSDSIATTAEAKALADRIVAAGQGRADELSWVVPGDLRVEPADTARLNLVNPRPQLHLGGTTTPDLWITQHDLAGQRTRDGISLVSTVSGIPRSQAVIDVVTNLGVNPVKDRAETQAQFLSSDHWAEVVGIDSPQPFIFPGPDRQLYRVRLLTANLEEIRNVRSSYVDQFRVGDMTILAFKDAKRDQPYLVGRVAAIFGAPGTEQIQ